MTTDIRDPVVQSLPLPMPSCSVAAPDPGYLARERFARLARELAAASMPVRSRWKEGRLFFFDPRRQADLLRTRPAPAPDPTAELSARIAAELPLLFASVEARQVARATAGLRDAAGRWAALCPAARDLAELLDVPDDEVFTVIDPARSKGVRLLARGVADGGQFQVLLADAAPELAPGRPLPRRFVLACRQSQPTGTAGVPMIVEARCQLYLPSILTGRSELPGGLAGSDHWLWPHTPLAAVPRVGGERVLLTGPPVFPPSWELTRRFPALAAELTVCERLSPAEVTDRLRRLGYRPGNIAAPQSPSAPARAA